MPVDLDNLIETSALGKTTVKVALEHLVPADAWAAPEKWQAHAPAEVYNGIKPPVADSPEVRRVLALPRRDPIETHSPRAEALVEMLTRRYAKPDDGASCDCMSEYGRPCIRRLREVQAIALYEMRVAGGFCGSLAVGIGKTLLDVLAPLAIPDCKVAVLLVPPKLIDPQLIANYKQISNHFRVPSMSVFGNSFFRRVPDAPMLYVIPYSLLSREQFTAKLAELKPDLIIADEVQNLRNLNSVRTGRVIWYKHHYPRVRYCCWSGSLTDAEIQDYAHHLSMALGEGSPLPIGEKAPEIVEDWARAINPSDWPAPPGPLVALCPPANEKPELKGQARLQWGYQQLLRHTEGIVITTEASIDAERVIEERKAPPIPRTIADYLKALRETWVRPDGEELEDALQVAACARQLACGFYLYWYFPKIHGQSQEMETILDWLDARKWWRKEVREELKQHAPHKDSPLLLTRAAMRYHGDLPIRSVVDVLDHNGIKVGEQVSPDLPVWESECWPRWRDTRSKVVYESRCYRIDPFLVDDIAEWGRANRGIIWYQSTALGQWVAEKSGLRVFGAGMARELLDPQINDGSKSIIVSAKAHGTGTDGLQFLYDHALVAQPPPSTELWEQWLGRIHRPGQPSPRTLHEVYRHTKEMADAVDEAITRATYVERTLGTPQALLGATLGRPQAWDGDEGYDDEE